MPARPSRAKRSPAKKRPAKQRPTKQRAKPAAKKRAAKPAKRSAYPALEMYLDNVAPNATRFGLEFALDTCISMFQYQLHRDYAKMKREAQHALDTELEPVLALARARRIAGLDAAATEAMLRTIVAAGEPRFEGAGE